MPTPIRYPDTTGFRAGWQSLILKVDGQEFVGFVACEGERARERALVFGTNADPIGKTRGKNTYKASIGVYVAEFKQFMVDHFGPGYGDRSFTFQMTIAENGYDVQTVICYGCTLDKTTFSFSEGSDPLKVEGIDLNPVKIVWDGVDDNARPLGAQPSIG
jgi:hypothetical protein